MFFSNWFLLGVMSHAHQTRIMVPIRVFFQNFRRAPPSFLYGRPSPYPPGEGTGDYVTLWHEFDGLPESFEEVAPPVEEPVAVGPVDEELVAVETLDVVTVAVETVDVEMVVVEPTAVEAVDEGTVAVGAISAQLQIKKKSDINMLISYQCNELNIDKYR